MSYKVYFRHSDKVATVESGESILAASIRAGLHINYGCSNGNCGLCSARLIAGEISRIQYHDHHFSAAEKIKDYFLMCSNTAVSDIIIHTDIADTATQLEVRSFPTKVRSLKQLNDTVSLLVLQSPRSQRLRFFAGQYARLQAGAGGEFSIASCPCDERRLEFHIPYHKHPFCQYIFNHCAIGETLQVTAPYGEFVFTEDLNRPIVLIGFGVGFASIKSLFEHIIAQESETPLKLYQVNTPGGHYLANLCRSWNDSLDQVEYYPIDLKFDFNADDGQAVAQCVNEIACAQLDALPVADVYCCAPAAAHTAIKRVWAKFPTPEWRLLYEPIRDRSMP